MADPATPDVDAEPPALDGSNYAVIRARLETTARELATLADGLNAERRAVFGGQELQVIGSERIRTEHNCVPRNIVNVGGTLLFGYNVQFALKKQVEVSDVFSLHRFAPTTNDETGAAGFDLGALPIDAVPGLLDDPGFQSAFAELYQYYGNARLRLLRMATGKLLAIFQVGERADDVRVFRWQVSPKGDVNYIDNRGERDHVWPAAHDFDWVPTTREDHVLGTYPHISIQDEVFVETVGGDLTIKVEDNTDDGQGIYREPVEDAHQSLDDADISWARVGTLLLLRVRPFGETQVRHLVFNTRTQAVIRIDAIGQACVQLPEDHGIIFPGGYMLRTGVSKVFDEDAGELRYKRFVRAPNGEDVMYVFHHEAEGRYVLLPYNLIRQEVATPLRCHGFSLFDDGTLVVFRAESDEPTRVHPTQIWRTPFCSEEFAAAAPTDGSWHARVGNADLVRGISDLLAIQRAVDALEPSRRVYEDLVAACTRATDQHHWLTRPESAQLRAAVDQLRRNAELIIDEFEKVQALRQRAREALAEAERRQHATLNELHPDSWTGIRDWMGAMTALRSQRGHIIAMREVRSIDLARLDELEAETVAAFDRISEGCVAFLLRDDALTSVVAALDEITDRAEAADKASDLPPLAEDLSNTASGLELLIEVVGSLEVGEATDRTLILERISEVFAHANRVRAVLESQRRALASTEAKAAFAAQFKLLSQGVSSALTLADSPERCDEQLSRLMIQLEELEGRFGEFEEYLDDITVKREEVYEAFQTRRQALMDERQRRAAGLWGAATRILEAVTRRTGALTEAEEIHSYFAADPMVLKLRKLADQLNELGDGVKAEELLSKLKQARQEALRGQRDRADLYEDGGDLIRLGRHRFSVNTQSLELTLVPRGEGMALHLAGTGFYEDVTDPEFLQTRACWRQPTISEDSTVYRAEYLAYEILDAATQRRDDLDLNRLTRAAASEGDLTTLVRTYAASRYEEGYERGVHDADAALILRTILDLRGAAGLLRFSPDTRAAAAMGWATLAHDRPLRERLHRQGRSIARMARTLPHPPAEAAFHAALAHHIGPVAAARIPTADADQAARYLAAELAADTPAFVLSAEAQTVHDALTRHLRDHGGDNALTEDLAALGDDPTAQYDLARGWVDALLAHTPDLPTAAAAEVAAMLVTHGDLERRPVTARSDATVSGLLGQHARVQSRQMTVRLDAFIERLERFRTVAVPRYRTYRDLRHNLLASSRDRLRLEEYQPKVMSAFVRNRLINDVYLPLIGDNLAKQLGAAGASKRTDTMGMLLLISPPGYGKTTLMEYVANRLGLVFMKVNGPALGHDVTSLDPSEAPNATARQEVEKINLSLEMGNNVMLYLDDIQHTHPELLQKFISLCDATRRIEGVWKGQTRTYDLRGKRFCVVMAGNPYTESGARFQVPDMLANRADTYNLGDILGGRDDLFALSYIENAVTASPALAPLAGRDPGDLQQIIAHANGGELDATKLSYDYSQAEIAELVAVLQRLFTVRDTLLKVNMEYIRSAGTEEQFRTEPAFKLQGSYRNMAKLTEKVASAMNAAELDLLIVDHYTGEAQTLTSGAEQNLLKLAELRGTLTETQAKRWQEIKDAFHRNKLMGGAEDDPVTRITGALMGLHQQLGEVRGALQPDTTLHGHLNGLVGEIRAMREATGQADALIKPIGKLAKHLDAIARAVDRDRPGLETALGSLGHRLVSAADKAVSTLEKQRAEESDTKPMRRVSPQDAVDGRPAGWQPHLELSAEADHVLRHAILMEVQRAMVTHSRMQSQAQRQLTASEMVLTGALPVMAELARSLTDLVGEHLPEGQREAFMDALRRRVARAIADLSDATGETVDPADVMG